MSRDLEYGNFATVNLTGTDPAKGAVYWRSVCVNHGHEFGGGDDERRLWKVLCIAGYETGIFVEHCQHGFKEWSILFVDKFARICDRYDTRLQGQT